MQIRVGERAHPGVEVRHGRGDGEEAAGAVGECVLPQEAVELELQKTVQAGQLRAPQTPIREHVLVQCTHTNPSGSTRYYNCTIASATSLQYEYEYIDVEARTPWSSSLQYTMKMKMQKRCIRG